MCTCQLHDICWQVVNKLLYVIFGAQLALVTVADVMVNMWLNTDGAKAAWYLHPPNATTVDNGYKLPDWFGYWLTFFGLLNNFVPMYVNLGCWAVSMLVTGGAGLGVELFGIGTVKSVNRSHGDACSVF